MTALSHLSPSHLWGSALALLAMLIYALCMLWIASVRGVGSAAGSIAAAAAGVPTGAVLVLLHLLATGAVAAPTPRALLLFAVAGVFSIYLGRRLVFSSIETIGPSRTAGVQSTSPLITSLFGWVLLGEMLAPAGLAGIALGMGGMILMSGGVMALGRASQPAPPTGARRMVLRAMLVALGSAAAYSASHVARAAGVREWTEPLVGTLLGVLTGLVALLLAGRGQLAGHLAELRGHPAGAAAYCAVGSLQFIAQWLVIASLQYIPAGLAALISMGTPLVVVPVSYFVLRRQEHLTRSSVMGILATLAGIALMLLWGRPSR